MGNFNPDNYAPVQDRIAEFFGDFPTGSIRTRIARIEGPDVIFEARVFRSPEDVERNVYTSGFAREKEGVGMVNKTSHVENCETSAVGRALANMNYPGAIDGRAAPRPSREEMQKVQQADPRGGERFVPEATVKYISAHAPGVGKSAQITVGEDTYNFREYVQANWRTIVSTPSLADAVAKVVEKETGVTFKPEVGR